ncbi:BhlA/UviB family holin-like peptide [Paenibacillus sp. MER 180]|uniref:BhlA/UviB family holin-like peptide n=1 Tax=Paenibacillus sp. MER 180 TaxID=2939570 RepID=UPI00203CBEB0|nr:BhlA/UviB family holin-like peptide [Paenibacillus sp. MER 180]MCM3291814.1 BhlA/UviB family holin-like peptide [Paenibacillus sp. MER 180]
MEIDMLKYFLTQGPFAVLFVYLFVSSRKESQEREKQLYEVIDKVTDKYDVIIDRIDNLERKVEKNDD